MTQQYLVLLVIDNNIACFRRNNNCWNIEQIEGEEWTSNSNIPYILDLLQERLESETDFSKIEFHLIYDSQAFKKLTQTIEKLIKLNCEKFQLLRWEPIKQRIHANGKILNFSNIKTVLATVCPLVESIFHYQNNAAQSEYQRALLEHETNIETIRQESLKLMQEKAYLQTQIDVLKRPALEYLITFMPLIYENFFMSVNPQDLALMAGSIQTPNFPSTYTEPDADTLQMLKRKFLNLPEQSRQQVISFSKEIPHKDLKVRKIMRAILGSE